MLIQLAQTLIDMQLDKNQLEKEAIEKQHQLETEVTSNMMLIVYLYWDCS